MNKRERDYFVSTCLKAGSVASWAFLPPTSPHPPCLHSLFRDTLGPVWIGCLLRRRAKHLSAVRWHCHLGGTRRPSWSQDLTGPPHSLFILLSPPLPVLLLMLNSLGQLGSKVALPSTCLFKGGHFPCEDGSGKSISKLGVQTRRLRFP